MYNIVTFGKKLMSEAFISLGKNFFPLEPGDLLGFRAGLGMHTLLKEDGNLVPGHDKSVFVEKGKDINAVKDALRWAKTLNLRRYDFGQEYEISDDKISLIAVMRRSESEDKSYISKKIIDILPVGEDKSSDDIYGVTPSIGKTAIDHYIGIPINGDSEEELLKNASYFIENFKDKNLPFEKILELNCENNATIFENEKHDSTDVKSHHILLSERRTQKKDVNQELVLEAQKTREKMYEKL